MCKEELNSIADKSDSLSQEAIRQINETIEQWLKEVISHNFGTKPEEVTREWMDKWGLYLSKAFSVDGALLVVSLRNSRQAIAKLEITIENTKKEAND
jgi:hypothetical protein